MLKIKNIFIVILIFSIFLSCSQDEIFYTIESEEKIEDSNLSNSISGIAMFEKDSTYYLLAGTRLLKKAQNERDWVILDPPETSPDNEITAGSAVLFNSTIYVVWNLIKSDGTRNSSVYSYSEGSGWNQTAITQEGASGDFSLFNLFSAGTFLLVQKDYYLADSSGVLNLNSSNQYLFLDGDTLNTSDSSLVNLSSNGTSTFSRISGAAVDSLGDLWISGNGLVFKNVSAIPRNFSAISIGSLSSMEYSGIYIFDNLILLPCSSNSNNNPFYYSFDGGVSWNTQSESDVRFSSFLKLPSSNIILAGTTSFIAGDVGSSYSGKGYYELVVSGTSITLQTNSFSDANNYTSTDSNLAEGSINNFFLDTNPDSSVDSTYALFALTAGNGVWLNKTDSSENVRKWYWE